METKPKSGEPESGEECRRLLLLRNQLTKCVENYELLCCMLRSGETTGLPHIRDAQRRAFEGDSFSWQDAQRELVNDWFMNKMKDYTSFIDHTLGDDLRSLEGGIGDAKLKRKLEKQSSTDSNREIPHLRNEDFVQTTPKITPIAAGFYLSSPTPK
eukprot:GEMP01022048.1.p1 GENE.GEMP01022048.1~~GEMP01022048.1.p1  ORF type:complete len:156 (+),score=27.16 GEMP01022048.1:107-574(+)